MDLKKCIVGSGKGLENSGLTVGAWGNISIRDPETRLVYLVPSAMRYDTIVEDDVVVCRLGGTIVRGHRKPTIEAGLHLAVYKNREKVNAVIHTYSICSMVHATWGKGIPLIINGAAQAMGDTCRCTQYTLPSSEKLAAECKKTSGKEANSCPLYSHGAVCADESMNAAFKVATVLEAIARIFCIIEATDGKPAKISPENVVAMKDFAKNYYGRGG